VRYKKASEGTKVKSVVVDRIKEWEIEKVLNKRKIREVVKYLV